MGRSIESTVDQYNDWLTRLARRIPLHAPEATGIDSCRFSRISGKGYTISPERYRPTLTPPVRQLLPDGEVLFRFERDSNGNLRFLPAESGGEQIVAGVRSCDLRAVWLLDQLNREHPADTPYLDRRGTTTLIGWNCLAPCSVDCFCGDVGSLGWSEGASLLVTPCRDNSDQANLLLIEALDERGESLLDELAGEPVPDGALRRQAIESQRPDPFGRQLAAPLSELPGVLAGAALEAVWQRHSERCFSCGSCNLVCPTCYCFESEEQATLDGRSGERRRRWDSCMLPGFAEVAGGHNFRPTAAARQAHRVKRKFLYPQQRHQLDTLCTGCGRCLHACTSGIDILSIVNDLVEHNRRADEQQ